MEIVQDPEGDFRRVLFRSYTSLKDRADGCEELKAQIGNKKNQFFPLIHSSFIPPLPSLWNLPFSVSDHKPGYENQEDISHLIFYYL